MTDLFTGAVQIKFFVPGPPKGKQRPRVVRRKKKDGTVFLAAVTPDQTVNYEAFVKGKGEAAMDGRAPLEGPLKVLITAIFPVAPSWSPKKREMAFAGTLRPTKKPDWDNIGKMVDSLNEIVWKDDAQIVDGHVIKVYGPLPGVDFVVQTL